MAKRKNTRSKAKSKKVSRKQVADSVTYNPLLGKGDPAVLNIMETQYGGQPVEGYMESLNALRAANAAKGTGTFANVSAPYVDPRGGTGDMTDAEFSQFLASTRNNPGPTGVMDKYITKEQGGSKKKAKKAKRNMDGPRPKRKSPVSRNRDANKDFGVQGNNSPFRK
jgi:hypothetical protein